MSGGDDGKFRAERIALQQAKDALRQAVADDCPGPHQVRQHRDMLPPWCKACRRTDDGRLVR